MFFSSRKRFIAFLAPVLFGLAVAASAPAAAAVPFAAGETLAYRWTLRTLLFVPVGRGELAFSVQEPTRLDGRAATAVRVEAAGSVRIAGDFDGAIETWFDAESFQALASDYQARDRRGATRETLRYCRETAMGAWTRERERDGNTEERREEFPVADFFHDPVSLMYYLRTVELREGAVFHLPVVADRKVYEARVRVVDRRRLRIQGRNWDTWRLRPDISLGGAPVRDRSLEIYVSDDERRLPLRLTTRAPLLGYLAADLVQY